MFPPTFREIEEAIRTARQDALDAGIDAENIDSVASAMVALRLMSSEPEPKVSIYSNPHEVPETFGEWAEHFTLATHFDKFLAVAIHLRDKKSQTLVNTEDIMKMYDKARWKKPANPADIFAKAAERRFFAEAEDLEVIDAGPKLWTLTRTGIAHFQSLAVEEYYEQLV